jgi:hypothetical protein
MKRVTGLVLALFTIAIVPAYGSDFRILGPRALSMGGAGVARPDGAYAVYWNPAALAIDSDKTEISLSVGGAIRETGIAEHLQNILDQDIDFEEAKSDPAGPDAVAFINELTKIQTDDAIFVMPGGAISMRAGAVGFGVYPSAQITIYADVDTLHINQTDPLVDPNSFFYNETKLLAQGLGLLEVRIGYGHAFDLNSGGKLCVGAAAKFMMGVTFDLEETITAPSQNIEDKLTESDEQATSFGIDLGMIYVSPEQKLALGVVAKNITSPGFDTVRGGSCDDDMQVRAGMDYTISKRWSVAADVDVLENDTLVPGYSSRWLGGGLCVQATGGIALRGGVMKNLAASDSDMVISVGLSIGFEALHIDLSLALPSEWEEYDGTEFPTEGAGILTIKTAW